MVVGSTPIVVPPILRKGFLEIQATIECGFTLKQVRDTIKVYSLEVYAQYLENLRELHNDFPFLLERMKIGMVEKLLTDLYDKKESNIHTRNLNQALNHELVLKNCEKLKKIG